MSFAHVSSVHNRCAISKQKWIGRYGSWNTAVENITNIVGNFRQNFPKVHLERSRSRWVVPEAHVAPKGKEKT